MNEPSIKSLQRVTKKDRPKIRKTIPELYRSIDLNGIIVDCNEAYAQRLGYTKNETIGMSLFDHSPKENEKQISYSFEMWKKTGKVSNLKIKLITKNNKTFDVLLTATNRYDGNGKLIGSATILRDITELKTLQNLVKLRKYQSLYEESPDMYRTVNYQGIIIDCNKSYEKKLGFSKDEIIGLNLLEHTATQSISAIRVNMANWRNTGKGQTTEIWMRKKDGTEFPAVLTPTNLYDDDGALIGRNVVIQDTTELYDTKQVLDEREKIDKMKEEFLSVITHELKSPLTPIIGFSQALSKKGMLVELNQKQTDAISIILSNAKKLRKLIVDLLDAHKLELEKMHFNYKEMNVQDLLDTIKLSFNYITKEKNIQTEFHIDENINTIISDPDRIEQVITNLMYNAIDFVPKDTGKIVISVVKIDTIIQFEIQDNGIGISKEKQKELFSKFYQADTTVTRQHGGTGLGLSICKGIVECLGGRISVESVENNGSKFYFTIPINQNEVVK